MLKPFLKLILILFTTIGFSQVQISGIVKDSIGNPLELANVIAVNQTTKAIESYNITTNKGTYKLNLAKNTTYKLNVSFLGMKTLQSEITTQESPIVKDFVLTTDNTSLEVVELTYKIPLKIKGDTLIYDADSFKNTSDKKLEDVLKRLPGVEVTKNGTIKVEGKEVKTIKVEGKRFFDGSTKLATKNIPAKVLDKIQVLKNQDEIRQLSGVRDNSENVAINIKLKEGKKNFWFGDIETGGGYDERYMVHPNLFYYSPKKSINVISDFNNTGEAPLSASDLSRFSARTNQIHYKSGTNFNVEAGDGPTLSLRDNKAKSIETKFVGANLNFSPNASIDISGLAIYSGTNTNTLDSSFRQYLQTASMSTTPDDELTTNNSYQETDTGIFKLSLDYIPNSKNQLAYKGFARVSNQELNKSFFSSVLQNIDEKNRQKPYKITQGIDYYYTLNDHNIFALESQLLLQKEDPFYNATIEQPNLFLFADNLGLDSNQTVYNINLEELVKTNKLDAKLDYWYVINRKSNINISLGALFSEQKFSSSIFQILDDNSINDLNSSDPNTTNNVTYNFNNVYLGIHYRLKVGAFTFAPGFSLHNYNAKNIQFDTETENVFTKLLPDFNFKVRLKSTENIRFNYRMLTNFADVNKLAEGIVMNSYNVLYQGNGSLSNTLSHNLSLSYTNQINMLSRYRFTTIDAQVQYNKTADAFRNQIASQGVLQVSSPINSNFEDESLTSSLRLTRGLWKLKAEASGVFSYAKFNQIFNSLVSRNETFTQSYNLALKTTFYSFRGENIPNFEVGYNYIINDYMQGVGNTKFFTDRLYTTLDASFLKAFTFKADYSYYNYRNQAKRLNRYSFLNAFLSYQKKDSNWEYKLSATNLLDTKSINNDSTNEFFTSTNQFFVQPRYVIFSLKYNL